MRKHNFILSFITAMTILAAVEAKGANLSWNGEQNVVPRLVVNILVDQLRSDYLEAFSPLYGEDGLNRLMRQGRVSELNFLISALKVMMPELKNSMKM